MIYLDSRLRQLLQRVPQHCGHLPELRRRLLFLLQYVVTDVTLAYTRLTWAG